MKTKAQKLNITDFPYSEYDEKGNEIYFEDSDGVIIDNRPKKETFNIKRVS